jgi:hypothetical protein
MAKKIKTEIRQEASLRNNILYLGVCGKYLKVLRLGCHPIQNRIYIVLITKVITNYVLDGR